jgi:hypothetical protein
VRQYLILAQTDIGVRVLEAWREASGYRGLYGRDSCPKPIMLDVFRVSSGEAVGVYESIANRIEESVYRAFGSGGVDPVTVFVETATPERLSAVGTAPDWDHLLAVLILAFPEVRWVFGSLAGQYAEFPSGHTLPDFLKMADRFSLLDPTGLRNWVRETTNKRINQQIRQDNSDQGANQQDPSKISVESNVKAVGLLPIRHHTAVSIDEEKGYAVYHAYAAYRSGHVVDVVFSWAAMKAIFHSAGVGTEYCLSFEDMRIPFSDKPGDVHLSDLAEREKQLPLLRRNNPNYRFLITTGQTGGPDDKLMSRNREYLGETQESPKIIFKPAGGLIDFWGRIAPQLTYLEGRSSRIMTNSISHEDIGGHGAPGILTLIAERLVRRAERIANTATATEVLINAAVLARDAVEILGGKTPTTALSGCLLYHELEVRAECTFLGAGYHIKAKSRLKEIRENLEAAAAAFNETRDTVVNEASATIISRLASIFLNAGMIEEHDDCLVELRKVNRDLRRPSLNWIEYITLWYAESLLGSFKKLLGSTLLWFLFFTVVAYFCGKHDVQKSFVAAGNWFFATTPEPEGSWVETGFSFAAIGIGLFHVGILISYLYSRLSRK